MRAGAFAAVMLPALAVAAPAASGRVSVAVLATTGGAGFDARTLSTLEELLLSSLAETGRFDVTGQSDVARLIGFERQKQLVGCSSGNCVAEIAGALGVSYILSPDVGRLGSVAVVSAKLIEVKSAEVAARVSKTMDDDSVLVPAVREIAREMARAVSPPGWEPPAPPPGPGAVVASVHATSAGAPPIMASPPNDGRPGPEWPAPAAAAGPPPRVQSDRDRSSFILHPSSLRPPQSVLRVQLDRDLGRAFDVRTFYAEGAFHRPGPDCPATLGTGDACVLHVLDRPLLVKLFSGGDTAGGTSLPGAGDYRIARRGIAGWVVAGALALAGAAGSGALAAAVPQARSAGIAGAVVCGISGAILLGYGAYASSVPYVLEPLEAGDTRLGQEASSLVLPPSSLNLTPGRVPAWIGAGAVAERP